MNRSLIALALVAAGSLASTADAGRVDVPLVPGQSASGTVATADAPSTCAFLVNEGDKRKLSITVKRSKGSQLAPDVVLVAPDGEELDVEAAGGSVKASAKATKIKLRDVPQSGMWRLEVRGADGSTGDYAVLVKANEKLSQKSSVTIALGGFVDVPVTVGDAQTMTVKAKRSKKSKVVPGIEVFGPDGTLLPSAVGAAAVNTKKGSAKLSKLELPSFGTYVVRFYALEASGGAATYSVKTAPTKLKGKRPTADPGPAFVVEPGLQGMLDGSASTAAGSGGLDHIWTQVAGPEVTLSERYAERPTFTAPAEDTFLAFQLTVSESTVRSAPQLVVVEVTDRPIADPGRAQVVLPGGRNTLDAGGSTDRSGRGLRAQWRIIEGPGSLDDTTSFTPEFSPPNEGGITRIGLVVDDGRARSFESEVVIVTSGTSATVADAGREQYVGRMATVHLSGLASQRAGAPLDGGASWTQVSGPSVELAGADTFAPSFMAPRTAADLLFELTVDGDTDTAHRAWVRVRDEVGNRAPVTRAGAHVVTTNGTAVLNASGSTDADGDDTQARWAVRRGTGASITDPAVEQTTATGLDDSGGLWQFLTQVHDGLQYGAPDRKRVIGNAYSGAPLVDAGADVTAIATSAVILPGSVTQSPGGGGLTIAWRQVSGTDWYDVAAEDPFFDPTVPRPRVRLPAGLSSLTTTRSLTFELSATDANGTAVPDIVTVTFTNIPPNGVPTAQATASNTNPTVGSTVSLSVTGDDPDGDPITFRWEQTAGPSVTLDGGPTSATPSFVAPTSGTLVFEVVANDGIDDGPASRVTIVVNQRPVAVATVDPETGDAGDTVTFDAGDSFDPEEEGVTYTWTQTAGSTVSFPSTAESFSVTAPDGGVSFRLVVNDGAQDSLPVTATFADAAPPSVAPSASVAGAAAVDAAYGVVVTLLANPSDTDGATFTWRQLNVGTGSPAVTLSSTSAENPTFTVPRPTTVGFGGNASLTFAVKATRAGIDSTEKQISVGIYASFNDTTLPGSAPKVWPIISSNCSSCHSLSGNSCPVGSGSNARGYGMGNPTAFITNSRNVASCSSVKPRVATGSGTASTQSFLVDRINGNGGFMPPGGGLSIADRLLIADWIDQGSSSTK
jgi:hypothetical protein